jgi:hypothetical protein
LLELIEGIVALRTAVLDLADQHLETAMPGRTGSQPAQPVTIAHQLLHWSATLQRHAERAVQSYASINQSPAGAAILTGSSFAMNRHRTAELMGFDGVITNTFDAIQGHDDELVTIAVSVSMNVSLARWSNDLDFCTAEAGYVRIPDAFCGSSSTPPTIATSGISGGSRCLRSAWSTFDSSAIFPVSDVQRCPRSYVPAPLHPASPSARHNHAYNPSDDRTSLHPLPGARAHLPLHRIRPRPVGPPPQQLLDPLLRG